MKLCLLLAVVAFVVQVAKAVTWQQCPYVLPVPEGYSLDCTNATVPLDWNANSSSSGCATIDLWVSRLRPTGTATPLRQLWMLAGGPGSSGESWLAAFAALRIDVLGAFGADTVLLLPDHRGTGLSAPLACSNPADPSACSAELLERWGVAGLAQFSATNAARDIDHLLKLIAAPAGPFVVFGASYGTLWTQRWLQIRTVEPEAVVLDGVLQPNGTQLAMADIEIDAVARALAAECATDRECLAAFEGRNASIVLEQLFAALRANETESCFSRLPNTTAAASADVRLKRALAPLVLDIHMRQLLLPVIFRLDRCNAADVSALTQFFSLQQQLSLQQDPVMSSLALRFNVLASELMTTTPWDPPPLEELEKADASLCASFGNAQMMYSIWKAWPRYKTDALFGSWPRTGSIPMLLMNGDFDSQTPFRQAAVARAVYTQQGDPNVMLARFHGSPHGTPFYSPVHNPSAQPCGMKVFGSFVRSGGRTADTSCLADLDPFDWMGRTPQVRALGTYFLGTADIWEL